MRRLLALLGCGVVLTGCGVLDEQGPAAERTPDPAVYGPAESLPREPPTFDAPKLRPPTAAVERALEGGQIGIVDLTGTVAIEPDTLETSSDGTLEGLRWSSWGADGADGTGELRLLDCQPTCAGGGSDRLPATIKLTGSKTCDGRRYFETGEVRLDAQDSPTGEQPATYLRAPC
jgi:hypothetical protein